MRNRQGCIFLLVYIIVFIVFAVTCAKGQPIKEQLNTPITNPLMLSIFVAIGITIGIISFIGWWSWPELKRAFKSHVLYLEYRFKLWNWKRKRK